jgi:hypothetical protein
MNTIPIQPIAEALVRQDEEFGPCILAVGGHWLTGY